MSSIRIPPGVLGLLLIVGCADRPASADLADAIVAAADNDPTVAVTADEAQCIAERLLASGLSDTTLEGLAEDFDSPVVLSAEIDRVEPLVAEAATSCIATTE